jgi:hypothetical protein
MKELHNVETIQPVLTWKRAAMPAMMMLAVMIEHHYHQIDYLYG